MLRVTSWRCCINEFSYEVLLLRNQFLLEYFIVTLTRHEIIESAVNSWQQRFLIIANTQQILKYGLLECGEVYCSGKISAFRRKQLPQLSEWNTAYCSLNIDSTC